MISELTNDLILKILSSLFFKEVITKSVLSKQWWSLRKLVPKLNVSEHECLSWMFIFSSVNSLQVLKSLNFKLISDYFYKRIEYWVKPVCYDLRELRIELLYTSMKLPISLYSCGTLKSLDTMHTTSRDVPPCVCLSSLKTLHLLSLKFSCDESIQRLLIKHLLCSWRFGCKKKYSVPAMRSSKPSLRLGPSIY